MQVETKLMVQSIHNKSNSCVVELCGTSAVGPGDEKECHL